MRLGSLGAQGTSKEVVQRAGRARAPKATFMTLAARGSAEEECQRKLNKWNTIVDQILNAPGPARTPPKALDAPPETDLLLTAAGALLPLCCAKDFLSTQVHWRAAAPPSAGCAAPRRQRGAARLAGVRREG